jgi:hypothetical protein
MNPTPRNGPIFLSAGVPFADPVRNPDGKMYPCDAIAVREAVRALVSVVAAERPLVFGGQPAVTPFVWDAANSLKAADSVIIFQSELFLRLAPPQARYFRNLHWTKVDPKDPTNRDECLRLMREEMIDHFALGGLGRNLGPYSAAIFIGGMDGVEREWERFTAAYKHTPVFPIGSTGGASALLLHKHWPPLVSQIDWNGQPPKPGELANELRYRGLFRKLLSNI